jgi:hypothetical protein
MPSNPAAAPFLRAYPSWYARTTGWIILALAATAIVFCVAVRFPVALEGAFAIEKELACAGSSPAAMDSGSAVRSGTPGPAACRRLFGQIEFPQSAFADVTPGQHIKLYYDALPGNRRGGRVGTILHVALENGHLRADFEAAPVIVPGAGGDVSLGAGATGVARMVVDSQTLLESALQPLREMRARWSDSAEQPGR